MFDGIGGEGGEVVAPAVWPGMHLCPDQNPLRHVCQKRSQVIDAYQRPRVHGVDNPAWPPKGFKRQLPGCFAVPVVMTGGARKSVVEGKGGSVSVDRGGRRIIKKKN